MHLLTHGLALVAMQLLWLGIAEASLPPPLPPRPISRTPNATPERQNRELPPRPHLGGSGQGLYKGALVGQDPEPWKPTGRPMYSSPQPPKLVQTGQGPRGAPTTRVAVSPLPHSLDHPPSTLVNEHPSHPSLALTFSPAHRRQGSFGAEPSEGDQASGSESREYLPPSLLASAASDVTSGDTKNYPPVPPSRSKNKLGSNTASSPSSHAPRDYNQVRAAERFMKGESADQPLDPVVDRVGEIRDRVRPGLNAARRRVQPGIDTARNLFQPVVNTVVAPIMPIVERINEGIADYAEMRESDRIRREYLWEMGDDYNEKQ